LQSGTKIACPADTIKLRETRVQLPIFGSFSCRHPRAFIQYLFPSRRPRPCRCRRT